MLACFIMLRHEERMGIHEKIGTLKMFQAKGKDDKMVICRDTVCEHKKSELRRKIRKINTY